MALSSCPSNGLEAWHPAEDSACSGREPTAVCNLFEGPGSGSLVIFSYGAKVTPLVLPQKHRRFAINLLLIQHVELGQGEPPFTSHLRPMKHFSYVFFHAFSQTEDVLFSYFLYENPEAPTSQGLTGCLHWLGPQEVPWTPE